MPNLIRLATMASLPSLVSSSTSTASSFSAKSTAFLSPHRSASPYRRTSKLKHNPAVPTLIMSSSSSAAAAAAAFLMAMPPSKGDLYNDDELFELLTIHQSLTTANDVDSTANMDDGSVVLGGGGGVHEWVLQCLNENLGDDDVDAQSINANGNPTVEISTIPDLHKFVLETIGDGNISSSSAAAPSSNDKVGGDNDTYPINQLAYENLHTLLTDRKPNIRAIATGMSLLFL